MPASSMPLEICRDRDSAFAFLGSSPVSLVLLDTEFDEIEARKFAERLRRESPGTDLALIGTDEPHDDAGELASVVLDTLNIQTGRRELLRQRSRLIVPVHIVGEPIQADLHRTPRNCLRNLRSFSYSRRMSSMPYLSMAMRSMPMPNAKPV